MSGELAARLELAAKLGSIKQAIRDAQAFERERGLASRQPPAALLVREVSHWQRRVIRVRG